MVLLFSGSEDDAVDREGGLEDTSLITLGLSGSDGDDGVRLGQVAVGIREPDCSGIYLLDSLALIVELPGVGLTVTAVLADAGDAHLHVVLLERRLTGHTGNDGVGVNAVEVGHHDDIDIIVHIAEHLMSVLAVYEVKLCCRCTLSVAEGHERVLVDSSEKAVLDEGTGLTVETRGHEVGFVVGGDEMEVIGQKGIYTEDDIETGAAKWCTYWKSYWKLRGTKEAYPKDYACEVTIPVSRD